MSMTLLSGLVAAVLIGSVMSTANAGVMTIDASDRGWYTETGLHTPSNTNYNVGDTTPASDQRNFFVFDLSGVTQQIVSAQLSLFVPTTSSGPDGGFFSADATETYAVFDITTSIASLTGGTGVRLRIVTLVVEPSTVRMSLRTRMKERTF